MNEAQAYDSIGPEQRAARGRAAEIFVVRSQPTRTRARALGAAFDRLYPRLTTAAEATSIPVGAEWMLDNHFVIRRALREVRTGLVRAFENRLPSIEAGQARPKAIELEVCNLLEDHQGLLDRGALLRCVREYTARHDVRLAELWALPLFLRLCLLEQLARDGSELLAPTVDSTLDHRVANSVRSLLWIVRTDWNRFVEEVSGVHEVLTHDPSRHYSAMDFDARDRYRRLVERIARSLGRSEVEVAERAVILARASEPTSIAAHVGFHLHDPLAREQLRRSLGAHHPIRSWLRTTARRRSLGLYVGAIATITMGHLVALAAAMAAAKIAATWVIVLACLLAVIPAWTIGVSLVNWLVTLILPPAVLPKLDFSTGVPERFRTLVVVPGMLGRPGDVDALVARLEGHYLATRDERIEFALATDFADADQATLPSDEELLAHARAGITALNRRHGHDGGPFHLFHRRRVWSERQGCFMGWERKRGKLEELNHLLRGREDTSYIVHEGRAHALSRLRYVLTLDADTILPPGAARRLIATLAHPLNQARFEGERVVSGYTVLQPRAEIAPEAAPTRFARVFAGDGAFDIYSRAVSDVYQDLFGEGIFVGKGIYDLDAFEASVAGRIPEDRVLSHDLLEGVLGRAGLVTDVLVYEDYPTSYLAHARRLHRWTRGDWQLLPWVGPWVPRREGWGANPLTGLSRWKIADNLRRSLLAPSLIAFAAWSWMTLPSAAWVWTVLVLVVMATPTLTELAGGVLRIRPGVVRPAVSGVLGAIRPALARWLMRLCFLAHEALRSCDAIARALIRTTITRRRQLEWTPAAIAGRGASEPRTIWREMGAAQLVPAGLAAGLAAIDPGALPAAAPLLLAWLVAPPLSIWSARVEPSRAPTVELDPSDPRLRRLARRTWAYFEQVVGPEDHWLPPDHFQEDPKGELAHRTSPTNIAMALLATLAAYDFGYIDRLELVVRLRDTLESLGALPQHKGHVLNWCDTTTLAPLEPRYVSTVDSGNLAAALLVLEQTCRELARGGRPLERRLDGLRDTLDVLAEIVGEWGAQTTDARERIASLRTNLDAVAGPEDWRSCLDQLEAGLTELEAELLRLFEIQPSEGSGNFEELRRWISHVRAEVASLHEELVLHTDRGHEIQVRARLLEIADRAAELVTGMDFGFLFDAGRELFHIGYDVSAERYDEHHYDLLASEARVASLVAIAKGEVPPRHWARLGRPLGRFGGTRALLSWSGTMFEYLMPPLLLDEGERTLLGTSARAAIRAQIDYARRRKVPWGVSESGYARLDSQRNYQYRAFGVPATGIRRELERELVVAPYASLLALRYEPDEVVANLERIAAAGGTGPLGAYEALDYTRDRVPLGRSHAVVRSYMSHHQGMIMLALHGFCLANVMVERAHRHPLLGTVELLLRERPPGRVPVEAPQPAAEGSSAHRRSDAVETWTVNHDGEIEAQLISNGRYGVLLTAGGAGHSWWRDLAVTRPCEDRSLEDRGFAIRVRDRDSDEQWSFLAADRHGATREVEFSAHGARISIHDRGLVAELSVVVAIDTDAEIRLLRLSDRAGRRRRLQISAFAELALDDPRSHGRHPAFSKLFVDSQQCDEPRMIICHRRPRTPGETPPWLGCALVSDSVEWRGWHSDRHAYLGRGGSEQQPVGSTRPVADTSSPMRASLDPCLALVGETVLEPDRSCECAVVVLVAPTRAALLARARVLLSMADLHRAVLDAEHDALERTHGDARPPGTLRRYQRLLSAVMFPRAGLRAQPEILTRNRLGQPSLWRHGISGDWPILLVRVASVGISTITELVRAQAHWHARGLAIDLVFLEEHASGYGGGIRQRLTRVFEREAARLGAPDGGVFMIHGAGLGDAEHDALLAAASLVVDAELDDLDTLLDTPRVAPLPIFQPEGQRVEATPALTRPRDLLLDNGLGGFTPDGREYLIHLEPGEHTPAPWINVIANPQYGCIVSERGAGYTWSQNAGLNRLTPWSNDALLDPPGESLYLRDELDGEVWSPLPAPAPAPAPYQIRHGAGYSSFVHHSHGLRQRVEVFVAPDEPVKLLRLSLENCWQRPRRLTVSFCVEWLLGGRAPSDTRMLSVEFDPEHEVALARNPWNPAFADRWACAGASMRLHGMSMSRTEFFGHRGDRRRPAGLTHIGLSGELSPGADPCAALQVHVDLGPGETARLHFVLGQADSRDAAIELASRYRSEELVDEQRAAVDRRWDQLLGAVEVHGPDLAFDLLVNRWLRYQCIASRLWGRTGFYQSSGAFGFRDQLQDVLALLHGAPELTRAHLLDAASRQVEAGDVHHWWHPPAGQGLRSRCSDDLVWLPFAVASYVEATGDEAILHESIPYLDSPPLAAGELERYEDTPKWRGSGTLYDHCMAALSRATTRGAHGLPLIGSCDWNDGFSRVGVAGRGESVWLGWFLVVVFDAFAPLCEAIGRPEHAASLHARVETLLEPLEAAWDGAWYRRAYDDDGQAIGSAAAEACQIDSIAQSFAVLSGRADPDRARRAMASVREQLVDERAGLIRLFAPAFDSASPRLGYIEAYPPGVRENGGQYTHAAIWVAWAESVLGEADRAHALLEMMLPTTHAATLAKARRYRVEPYAIAADVYAEWPHEGRGGWTWYTGAAGWAYRLAVERILGVRRERGRIVLDPALPSSWPCCELILRERGTEYRVRIERRPEAPTPTPVRLPEPDGGAHRLVVSVR